MTPRAQNARRRSRCKCQLELIEQQMTPEKFCADVKIVAILTASHTLARFIWLLKRVTARALIFFYEYAAIEHRISRVSSASLPTAKMRSPHATSGFDNSKRLSPRSISKCGICSSSKRPRFKTARLRSSTRTFSLPSMRGQAASRRQSGKKPTTKASQVDSHTE